MNLLDIAVKVGWPTDEELNQAREEAEREQGDNTPPPPSEEKPAQESEAITVMRETAEAMGATKEAIEATAQEMKTKEAAEEATATKWKYLITIRIREKNVDKYCFVFSSDEARQEFKRAIMLKFPSATWAEAETL